MKYIGPEPYVPLMIVLGRVQNRKLTTRLSKGIDVSIKTITEKLMSVVVIAGWISIEK